MQSVLLDILIAGEGECRYQLLPLVLKERSRLRAHVIASIGIGNSDRPADVPPVRLVERPEIGNALCGGCHEDACPPRICRRMVLCGDLPPGADLVGGIGVLQHEVAVAPPQHRAPFDRHRRNSP